MKDYMNRKSDRYHREPFWREAVVLLTVMGLFYWGLFEVAMWLMG